MSEYDALEWLRALVIGPGLLAGLVAFARARGDLQDAKKMPRDTREHADDRLRRILRMHNAIRWSLGVSFVLTCALVVAVMAIKNDPLLPIASNLNQIVSALVLSLLSILQIHDRTAIALISEVVEPAGEVQS